MCAICRRYHLLINMFNDADFLKDGIIMSWECTRRNKKVLITLREKKKRNNELAVDPVVIEVQLP